MGGSAGGHGDVLRGSRGDAAGTKSGSSSIERIAVNTGTVPVPPGSSPPAWSIGLGPSSADRSGTGRSRRSTPSTRKACTWGRAAAVTSSKEAAMPTDAPVNAGAPAGREIPFDRVSEMQAKLHRWAAADPGRRFDDLFNLVHHPATLQVAWTRVVGNTGGRTAGVDGINGADVERIGVQEFLDQLRDALKAETFRPLPVRERLIPKPGGEGRMRRLGIPTLTDRVVQAALKLVLDPIFEADLVPVSYGFRPQRRGTTRSLRFTCSAPSSTGGCSTLTSRR